MAAQQIQIGGWTVLFTVATGGAFFCASSISQRLWGHRQKAALHRHQALKSRLQREDQHNHPQASAAQKTSKEPSAVAGQAKGSQTESQAGETEEEKVEKQAKKHHNKKNVAYGVVCGLVTNIFFRKPKSRTALPKMLAISGAYALGSLAAYYLAMGLADHRELADVWRQLMADLPVLGLTKWGIDLWKGLFTEATLAPVMEGQQRQPILQDTFKYKKVKKGVEKSQAPAVVREEMLRLRSWPKWVMRGHYLMMFCYLVFLISVYEERVYIPRQNTYTN